LKQLGLPSKTGTGKQSIGLTIDKELCFDTSNVAECFNHFYTTVAANLVSKLLKHSFKFGKDFLSSFYSQKGVFPNNFSFSLVSDKKVQKYLNYVPKRPLVWMVSRLVLLLTVQMS